MKPSGSDNPDPTIKFLRIRILFKAFRSATSVFLRQFKQLSCAKLFCWQLATCHSTRHNTFLGGPNDQVSGFKKPQFQQLFQLWRDSRIFHGLWPRFGSVLSTGVFSDKVSLAALFTSTFWFFKHFFVDTQRLRYLLIFNYPWFFALPPFVCQTFANAKTVPRVAILLSWPIVSGSLNP